MKIRKGDLVQVMSGKKADKGKQAKVLKVFKSVNKVLVEGVNIVTKHIKKTGTNPGQIVKMEKPLDASKLMLVCPFTNKPTRVGIINTGKDGKTNNKRFSKKAVKEQNKKPSEFIIK